MKKRKLLLTALIVLFILALLALGCYLVSRKLAGELESQLAAERWTGEDSETDFAQLSCFFPKAAAVAPGTVYSFRQTLDGKLTEASLAPPENGRLYVDAWSASGSLQVSGEHGTGTAAVTAVGGDYFFFHPLRLLSGSYISEGDMMDDRVVLDRELAWRLFGGTELEGMTVTIGTDPTPYLVAGVVEREQDFASRKAHDGGMGLYMSYRAYARLTSSAETEDAEGADAESTAPPIGCYEIVMPQPVDGFAEEIVKDGFQTEGWELVNNTERFSTAQMRALLRDFGTRSMRRGELGYPEWENAARCLGDWCALFLALSTAFGILPAVAALIGILVLLVRLKDYLVQKIPGLISAQVEKSRKKRRGAHQR